MKPIYFDYASTTPTDPEVVRAMEPYFFEVFGNPSSPHTLGRNAKKAIEGSRETLARFIGAKPEEIVFTSGGTESNNHALIGVARSLKNRGNHLIVSRIEHHSVLEPAGFLEKEGFRVTYLEVDKMGVVDPECVREAITPQTILIAVMHASNEIGTIQDVSSIGKIAKERKICFHVDAVQTIGHIPVSVSTLDCDTLAMSAHKFYGPKGIGALFIKKGTPISRYLMGGDQENGRRASTQNVPSAVGMAKAIELCGQKMTYEFEAQTKLRDRLLLEMPKRIDGVFLNGHPVNRLPNNAHFSFTDIDSESLIMSLDIVGIAASMGSACTSGALEPSHVLRAIGLSDALAYGSLRLSIGRWTTEEHINEILNQLPIIVERLRKVESRK